MKAQYNLGVCCAKGEGVAKDEAEGVKWFLKAAEQGATDAVAQITQLTGALSQSESDRLRLESELGHMRGAYADTRTRLAELFAQNEAQAATAATAAAEAETTALALAGSGHAEQVEQLTAQVQALETELEAVRANASRLAGQVALRPQLSSTQQQEYAALAGDPERVVAALHQRNMQVADARAETDYLRRTVGMLTGMGAELAQEVERRRREQQLLAYQVAGLTAEVRNTEMKQIADKQAEIPAADLAIKSQEDEALETRLAASSAVSAEMQKQLEEESAAAAELRLQLEERSKELEALKACLLYTSRCV